MARVLKIGAPSLMDEGARQTVDQVFGDAEFPHRIRVTNRFSCRMAVAELGGMHLEPIANPDGLDKREFVVKDKDLLVRAVASMEQVSEMNKIPYSMTFESVEDQSGGDQDNGENNQVESGERKSGADANDGETKATKSGSGKTKK
ncbi:hypothetical protein SAMN05216302_101112 [Nitrosomonas aestuarii]|uniref:Uncharacterized protein n=1 Tax=Nitrosomonas aestuarii TaxID=52441 RepID=A0A1I4B636_9PROT|nr:hypothetical protein [Nitrosomonas aestuarii]SFK63326.1 hypothetical protein SAMN05216302_101112 [Nitrosomonas aestuarii]